MEAGLPRIVDLRRKAKRHAASDGADLAFDSLRRVIAGQKQVVARARTIFGNDVEAQAIDEMLLEDRHSGVGLIKLIPVVRVNKRHGDFDAPAEQVLVEERDGRSESRTRADSIHAKANSRFLVVRPGGPALDESPRKTVFRRAKEGLCAPFEPG